MRGKAGRGKAGRRKAGTTCYTQDFDVILLVGLTELKAQIGWIDPATVSSQIISSRSPLFLIFVMCGPIRGWRKGSKHSFQIPSFLRLNSLFRSDAVVVYDNPSERTT